MLTRRAVLAGGSLGLSALGLSWWGLPGAGADEAPLNGHFEVAFTPDEWRKRLTPDQFAVLRRSGTERPYSSALLHEKREGVFACAGCARDSFSSATKFDSGTGWPSFWAPLDGAVAQTGDGSFGMTRTAVSCARCGGHLGHVFADGPKPTGLRYCMNGIAMTFRPTAA